MILVSLMTLCLVPVSVRAEAQSSLGNQRVEIEAQKREKKRGTSAYVKWMERIGERVTLVSCINMFVVKILVGKVPALKNIVPFVMVFGTLSIVEDMMGGSKVKEWKEYVGIVMAGLVSGRLYMCNSLLRTKGLEGLWLFFVAGGVGILVGMASVIMLRGLMERYERYKCLKYLKE